MRLNVIKYIQQKTFLNKKKLVKYIRTKSFLQKRM